MKQLPAKVSGHAGGNHKTAVDRTRDIFKYVEEAAAHLDAAANEDLGQHIRGGHLREGDDKLDAIIRFAECAKKELRIAHAPEPSVDLINAA